MVLKEDFANANWIHSISAYLDNGQTAKKYTTIVI